ncbi:TetR/AcrR family transcriptional regulator [Nocardia bovistercoris]|uniref:TetR/AcrR family transcriptional regulator n=1 Tax=Nocardia bovistercoris TaxID=2785916 RepID=A0A931IAK7_9NOCA|nr:TetR/AcrR family transcriptional regulator [Nocardia bovistercoris]MBH0776328.1 TetR/AcrR family transcriptional regulator [Nocardia bovistercoris]
MSEGVKGPASKKTSPLWDARKAETEQKIIEAATRLFIADGYATTSLAAVADAAKVGTRTVYLRFGSKAELLKRAIDVAIVGDAEPIDLAHRDWYLRAATAPTLHERIAAYAPGNRALMERVAPLIAVAVQAEAGEPMIAQAAQAGRTATMENIAGIWRQLHTDGLLHPDADLDWIIATLGTLGQAETYILLTRTLDWDPATYQRWLHDTWLHFATTPSHPTDPRP